MSRRHYHQLRGTRLSLAHTKCTGTTERVEGVDTHNKQIWNELSPDVFTIASVDNFDTQQSHVAVYRHGNQGSSPLTYMWVYHEQLYMTAQEGFSCNRK